MPISKEEEKVFKKSIGYSDHSIGTSASIGAINLGANIIEKHFYLGKGHNCVDKGVSLDPKQMRMLQIIITTIPRILKIIILLLFS